MCVELEHRVSRLEAERDGIEWQDPIRTNLPRMKGIRRLQTDGQAKRLAALDAVLIAMSEERLPFDMPRRHEEIAQRVAAKLRKAFGWRSLYREPYRTRWREVDDVIGSHPADLAATASDRARWSKPLLTWRILRLADRRDELLTQLRARLLEESEREEGWEPIPPR